jgi:hypothetical protein
VLLRRLSFSFALSVALSVALSMALAGPAAAMPTRAEFERALASVQPDADQISLPLKAGRNWMAALSQRIPLLATFAAGSCFIDYNEFTPGQDFSWLSWGRTDAEKKLWLEGLLAHELTHCADFRRHGDASTRGAIAGAADRHAEVAADLGFAAFVFAKTSAHAAEDLINHLASIRRANEVRDPDHDSSAALECAVTPSVQMQLTGNWPSDLDILRDACGAAR